MRLLRAELAKLARPLTFGVAAAAALFCLLLAAGGTHNAMLDAQGAPRHLPSCAAEGVPAGPQCSRWQAAARAGLRQIEAEPAQVAGQLAPAAAGAEAAGLIASLPGALAMALLAGAHVGGEWSGRTMKSLLTQHGRRWQVLVAKLVSLWLAGLGLIAACWAALALAGPVLARVSHLPGPHQTVAPGTQPVRLAGGQGAARAGRVRRHRAARRGDHPGRHRHDRGHGGRDPRDARRGGAARCRALDAGHLGGRAGWASPRGSARSPPCRPTSGPGSSAPAPRPASWPVSPGWPGLVVAGLAVAERIFRRADISG